MRVSVDKRDPGFTARPGNYKIKLNGEFVDYVVTADEEAGFVRRYAHDPETRKVLLAPDGEHFQLETVEGRVEIVAVDGVRVELHQPSVEVERAEDGVVEVLVYSRMRRGNLRRTRLDEDTLALRGASLAKAVAVYAGAAAEHMCAAYGDVFDPSDVAKLALERYERMLAAEASRPPKSAVH